jgi:chromosome condensin MukBEF ATPase and DNA-binding subunit MukB
MNDEQKQLCEQVKTLTTKIHEMSDVLIEHEKQARLAKEFIKIQDSQILQQLTAIELYRQQLIAIYTEGKVKFI